MHPGNVAAVVAGALRLFPECLGIVSTEDAQVILATAHPPEETALGALNAAAAAGNVPCLQALTRALTRRDFSWDNAVSAFMAQAHVVGNSRVLFDVVTSFADEPERMAALALDAAVQVCRTDDLALVQRLVALAQANASPNGPLASIIPTPNAPHRQEMLVGVAASHGAQRVFRHYWRGLVPEMRTAVAALALPSAAASGSLPVVRVLARHLAWSRPDDLARIVEVALRTAHNHDDVRVYLARTFAADLAPAHQENAPLHPHSAANQSDLQ